MSLHRCEALCEGLFMLDNNYSNYVPRDGKPYLRRSGVHPNGEDLLARIVAVYCLIPSPHNHFTLLAGDSLILNTYWLVPATIVLYNYQSTAYS